jgi:hypothetical protein
VIEVMGEGTGNLLGFRVTGKLSQADYRDVLVPCIESLLDRFPTLKVLVLLDQNFEGWTPRAAFANTIFDVKHRRDFEKVAMVGAPKREEWCVKTVARLLITGELRSFRSHQLAQAWNWLRA